MVKRARPRPTTMPVKRKCNCKKSMTGGRRAKSKKQRRRARSRKNWGHAVKFFNKLGKTKTAKAADRRGEQEVLYS